jgi:hypothetical protein
MNPNLPIGLRRISVFFLLLMAGTVFCTSAAAQRRDFMTEAEIEIIRDAQDIDARVAVLTRMIDRRFAVLGIEVNGWKAARKESEVWGDLPKGSRLELFSDIKKLLQKAVDDIDNLASNPNAAPIREKGDKRAKDDPSRFANAVRDLGAAAARYIGPLRMGLDKAAGEMEKGPVLASIELCDQIIEAVGKLPAEVKKTKN